MHKKHSRWLKIGVILGLAVIYTGMFLALYSRLEGATYGLSIIVVAIAGWQFGLGGGVLTALILLPINLLLSQWTEQPGWANALLRSGTTSLFLLLIGGGLGWLRDLRQQLQAEIAQRVRGEEALQESENKYRTLVERSPDIIYRLELLPQRRCSYINSATTRLLGYSPQEYYDDPEIVFERLIHPDDRAQAQRDAQAPDFVSKSSVRYVHKEGHIVWMDMHRVPIYDDQGRLVAIEGTAHDISEQVQVEEKLHLSEAQLRAQYQAIPIPTYTWQRSGDDFIFIDHNEAATVITQGTAARFLGQKASEFYRNSPEIFEDISSCFSEKTTVAREMQYQFTDLRDRKHLAVKYAFVPPDLILVHTEDITDRVQREQALRMSEERLALAILGSEQGLWDWDIVSDETYLNPRYYELIGYKEGEIRPDFAFFKSLVHPDDFPTVARNMEEHLQGQRKHSMLEYRIRRKSGEYIWIQGVGRVVMRDEKGTLLRMVGTITDITERKQIEEALRQARTAAEAASRAKSALLSTVSHELRTPLSAIIVFSQLLLRRPDELNEKQTRHINNILQSGQRLVAQVNNILALSEILSGTYSFQLQSVYLPELLDVAVQRVQRSAHNKKQGLQLEVAPEVDTIKADPAWLLQILHALLENAVKFTEEGGEIRIHCSLSSVQSPADSEQVAESNVQRSLNAEQGVLISVKDSGIGIKPEQAEVIYSLFEQVDMSNTRLHEGAGLGLSLVKLLVERHGGRIWFESEGVPGKGTTFYVSLLS